MPGLAVAGPNEGGTLILHANPGLVFTSDIQDYCGMSALDSCAAAVTSVAWDPEKRIVFHVLAAFPSGSSPRLKALSFGIDFDSTKFMLAARRTCADFEIPGDRWPGPGAGTSQSWTTGSQTGLLTEVYWFAGYTYSEQTPDSTSVALIPHPLQHGVFVDDAFPSEVDTIAAYGRLGFGTQGTLPCPLIVEQDSWTPGSPLDGVAMPESPEPGPCSDYSRYLRWAGSAYAPWLPFSMAASNEWVYATAREYGSASGSLHVFQPHADGSADFGGTVSFPTQPQDVAVAGDYAYVALDNCLFAVDATDHVYPTIADVLPGFTSSFTSVAVSGQRLYATNEAGELRVVIMPTPDELSEFSCMQGLTDPWDVVVIDSLAYVADGSSGLRVVKLPLAGTPTIMGTADTPDKAIAVAVEGNLACVADMDGGLQVIDVTDPTSPYILGNLPTTEPCKHVVVSNGMAYATGPLTFYAIDLADPTHPVIVKTTRVAGALHDLAIWGQSIYVAGEQPQFSNWDVGAIHIIKLGSDYWLTSLGNIGTAGWACGVAVAGTRAYIADYSAGLQVIDCSDPANPEIVGVADTPGLAMDVAVSGTHAYVADGESGLQIIDITNPQSPHIVASMDTQGTAKGLVVSGTRAYVADGLRGLRIFDITDPENPDALPSVETPGDACAVAVSGGHAYVADFAQGLQIIDLEGPQSPRIATNVPVARTASKYLGVAMSGRHACVADLANAMWIIDTLAPAEPANGVDIIGTGRSIAVQGGRAYVAAGPGGLQVIDVSNPANPVVAGAGSTPGFANRIAVAGSHAFIADDGAGLQIIELIRPASPPLLGSLDTPGRAKKVVVSGSTAYVADGPGGLRIIDVSDPRNPVSLSSCLSAGGDAVDVVLDEDWAYVADRAGRIWAVDVTDPEEPHMYVTSPQGNEPSGLALSGGHLYVAADDGGLQVYGFVNRFPVREGGAESRDASDVVVTQSRAYVTDSQDGLLVFDVSDPEHPQRESYFFPESVQACGVANHGTVLSVTGPFGLLLYNHNEPYEPYPLFSAALPSPAYDSVIQGDDDYVYIADGVSGLNIFDKRNPLGIIGNFDAPGVACGVAVQGDYAYVAADSSGLLVLPAQCASVTAVPDPERMLSGIDGLRIVPNPSSSGMSVSWNLARGGVVRGAVADVSGRRVRSLIDTALPAGFHSLIWDGMDENHRRVASGIYWVDLRTRGGSGVARVVLLR